MTSDRKDRDGVTDGGEEPAPNSRPRRPVDVDALRRLTDSLPMQPESAGDFVRRMRDKGRY